MPHDKRRKSGEQEETANPGREAGGWTDVCQVAARSTPLLTLGFVTPPAARPGFAYFFSAK
jgi:hypothetical protein